jgi:hypothetical protein
MLHVLLLPLNALRLAQARSDTPLVQTKESP